MKRLMILTTLVMVLAINTGNAHAMYNKKKDLIYDPTSMMAVPKSIS